MQVFDIIITNIIKKNKKIRLVYGRDGLSISIIRFYSLYSPILLYLSILCATNSVVDKSF